MGATNEQGVINIDLSATRKKRFTIDNDPNRVIELNTSDMTILLRLDEAERRLQQLADKANLDLNGDVNTDNGDVVDLIKTDEEMRSILNYLFDSPISDVCAPDGSMYDPFNGKYRFEHIMEALFSQYEKNIEDEVNKMRKNVRKHTDKYTKKN